MLSSKINKSVFQRIKKKILLFCAFLIMILSDNVIAQSEMAPCPESDRSFISRIETGVEYLRPTRFSNKIETTSLNAFFWKEYFKKISVMVSAGLTANYSWGHIRHLDFLSDSVVQVSQFKTSAFGIGPALQTEYAPITIKRFSLLLEVNGAFLLYDKRFPHGGERYNFMFRAGPSVSYRLSDLSFLKIGYRWAHVSNGKGYGRQNPFYEAHGINLSFVIVK